MAVLHLQDRSALPGILRAGAQPWRGRAKLGAQNWRRGWGRRDAVNGSTTWPWRPRNRKAWRETDRPSAPGRPRQAPRTHRPPCLLRGPRRRGRGLLAGGMIVAGPSPHGCDSPKPVLLPLSGSRDPRRTSPGKALVGDRRIPAPVTSSAPSPARPGSARRGCKHVAPTCACAGGAGGQVRERSRVRVHVHEPGGGAKGGRARRRADAAWAAERPAWCLPQRRAPAGASLFLFWAGCLCCGCCLV